MAASVTQEEMVSIIISHWLDTMSYVTAPDRLPMIQIVSHCETNGVCLESIKGKVANSGYSSLEEFVNEFVMLLEFEREELNRNLNSEVKTAQRGIKTLSQESKSQVFAAYGIFILEQYLEDWKSKTLEKVRDKSSSIEELYEILLRKKQRSILSAKPAKVTRTSKLHDENPVRVSKRISAATKNTEKSKISLETGETDISNLESKLPEMEVIPQPCSSYEPDPISSAKYGSSDEEVPTSSTDLCIKFPMDTLDISKDELEYMDETTVEIFESVEKQVSKSNSENQKSIYSHQSPENVRCENLVIERCRSEPIHSNTAKFQPSNQNPLKNASSYHSEDPLEAKEEISSSNLEEIQISEETFGVTAVKRSYHPPKRKRKIFFDSNKRLRKERKMNVSKSGGDKHKKLKPAEINVNTNNNNECLVEEVNNNVNIDNLGDSGTEISDEDSGSNTDTNNTIEIPENNPKTLKKYSPIIYDLSDLSQRPTPHTAPINISRSPRLSPPIQSGYYTTPQKPRHQFFPRYPYTTYPPTQHAPLHRFYSKQRIPSFSMIRRQFPAQMGVRQQPFMPNHSYHHSKQNYFH